MSEEIFDWYKKELNEFMSQRDYKIITWTM